MSELTANAYDVDEVHPQGKEKHREEVRKVRRHMEKYLHGSRVVKHLRRLCTEREDLTIGMSTATTMTC